ncbi:hypothetical protein [Sphingomonas sp. M1A8_2b]
MRTLPTLRARTIQNARNAITITRYKIAPARNYSHIALAGYVSGIGDLPMRMFETVTSTMLAIAAQALVVGVVITAL